ncbi:DUF3899 domain-containing protein [uncultured Granulicatella sp.]|uniref:DUF3899 domain-containing protein n=1 Tax=uncultured Granulicatella sp. TaxID=316089 RepID=UPI0028D66C59|nr:DUF3899 domain-containing protein [uncultured Granulicatella sp.]
MNKRLFLHALGTTIILTILVIIYASLTKKIIFDFVYIGNSLTLLSFPFLIIGLTLLVIQSGNFDFFLYSFRSKKKGYVPQKKKSYQSIIQFCLWTFAMLWIISILLTFPTIFN